MLAHHPAATNTHKYKHVHTHSVIKTLSSHQSHAFFLLSLFISHPHINTHAHTHRGTSEGPTYVRALSKHIYGCYMLQLLPDGLGENLLRLFFLLAH